MMLPATLTESPTSLQAPTLRDLLEMYPTLPPAERKVADFVLAAPQQTIALTTTELAARAGTSQPAVSRLCQRLGSGTYQSFRVRLAQDLGAATSPAAGPVGAGAPPASEVDPLIREISAALERDYAKIGRAHV